MTKMRYDSGVFYSLRCSVISGNKCRVRPGGLSIARSVILHSAFRKLPTVPQPTSADFVLQITFRIPHFRRLPTPEKWASTWGMVFNVQAIRHPTRTNICINSVVSCCHLLPVKNILESISTTTSSGHITGRLARICETVP